MTMATPGQLSVCFSCGQPLPLDATAKAPGSYPLTNNIPVPTPPPNPYSASASTSFILTSSLGTFKVSPGGEVLVGRDPARCAIHLTEPRVSALHATMKIENGALFVRDERSNNGVWINGERTTAGSWAEVPKTASLRFGPIQFTVAPG